MANDRLLFEKLSLEGFQAGLSWLTVLRKRPTLRRAFADFDLEEVAGFDSVRVDRLLADPGIIRHRGKIESVVHNARRALELADEFGSLAAYVWRFEPHAPRLSSESVPSRTEESEALSGDLRRRGWGFIGPVSAYAFMQAMGLVNDHLEGCFRRPEVEEARRRFPRP